MNARDPKVTDRLHDRAPLSTRADPPRPRRLSRKALAAICGVSAIGIAGALAYSLGTGRNSDAPQESVSVERRQTSDLLSSAPTDYSDLARNTGADIGPPPAGLPVEPVPQVPPDGPASPAAREADTAEKRRIQQAESARSSKLFAGAGERGTAGPDVVGTSGAAEVPPAMATPQAPSSDAPSRRAAFLSGPAEPSVNSGRLSPPAGRFVISAGSTIAAALVTGLSSDLPGQVVAQVTEDVFDSATGSTRLIPQGARLIGTYDANVSYGQNRALVVWTRLILPDGRSLDLDRLVGTDASGRSGFADRVDNHWGTIVKAGLLSTLLGFGSEASGLGGGSAIADAIRDSAGQSVGRAGDRIVERQLGVQPTITIRPGARVRVLVSRDLVLTGWPERPE